MKEHIERVLETLKNKSEFLQLELQEKVEQIDEISLKTMKSAKEKLADKAVEYHYDDNKHYARAYASRALNMGNKIRKKEMSMKKEEVEQIDEISKKTLGNYVAKAVVDVHNDARWAGETDDKDAKNRAFKRLLGVKSAASRLSQQVVPGGRINNFRRNNEEVEQIDEVDMGQAEKGMRTSTTHTGGYHVIHSKSGKVVSKHKSQFDAMRALNRHGDDDHELKAVHESADKERPYVVVHAKKGLHKTTAKTSYEAAQKAASHWKLKSTAGIDAHPADSDRFMHEEVELDEARNSYALYDDHPKYQAAHNEIHAAVTNAHKDPKAIVKAMRKHKQVGATDTDARETIHAKIKRLHGAKVANATKVLDEEVELEEGNKENKQKLRTVDRTVGKNWNSLDLHKTLAPTSPLRMGRAVRRFAKSDTYKALAKGDKVDEAVQDATTPTQAQATVGGRMKSLAQSIKSKKKGKDSFDANPEFVSQVQPNASNY